MTTIESDEVCLHGVARRALEVGYEPFAAILLESVMADASGRALVLGEGLQETLNGYLELYRKIFVDPDFLTRQREWKYLLGEAGVMWLNSTHPMCGTMIWLAITLEADREHIAAFWDMAVRESGCVTMEMAYILMDMRNIFPRGVDLDFIEKLMTTYNPMVMPECAKYAHINPAHLRALSSDSISDDIRGFRLALDPVSNEHETSNIAYIQRMVQSCVDGRQNTHTERIWFTREMLSFGQAFNSAIAGKYPWQTVQPVYND